MILKEREVSMILKKLLALDKRVRNNHPERARINSDLYKKLAEKRVEEEVYYFLTFLDQKRFSFMHSIRIPDERGFFQIDTLVLSPYFNLILEVKNWSGTVLFGESGQVIRVRDDRVEEGFPNPIPQVYLQRHRLHKWFLRNGFNPMPIYAMVVISFPSTVIKSIDHQSIPQEVIHSNQLKLKINNLANEYAETISTDTIHQIANKIKSVHTPEDKDVVVAYNVHDDNLIKGVICKQCSHSPMEWKRSKMYCSNCKSTSVNSYLTAINDYSLLKNNKAKNRELRQFLQIKSPHVMKRLMKKARFASIGNTSATEYLLDKRNK